MEHVTYQQAISFFREAHRVLAAGGVLRVTVPSLEQIRRSTDATPRAPRSLEEIEAGIKTLIAD